MRLGMDAPLTRYQPGEVGPLYWPTNLMAKVDWVWMRSSLPDSWANVSVVRSSETATPWGPGRTRVKGRPKGGTEGGGGGGGGGGGVGCLFFLKRGGGGLEKWG